MVNQDAYDGGNNSKQKEGNNQNSNVVKNTGGIISYDASMVDGAMSIPAPSWNEDLNLKNTSVKIIADSSVKLNDKFHLNEELNNVMGMNVINAGNECEFKRGGQNSKEVYMAGLQNRRLAILASWVVRTRI